MNKAMTWPSHAHMYSNTPCYIVCVTAIMRLMEYYDINVALST